MAKHSQRIGLVQVDADEPAPRDERLEALALAIEHHGALTAALADNTTNTKRAEEAWFTANRGVDAATQAVENAKQADAEAIAEGRAIGAAKAARVALTDAEDQRDATKAAQVMLKDQHADLTNRLEIAQSRVDAAVAAVIHKCPQVRELIDAFRAAQRQLFETREALRELGRLYGALPEDAQHWDVTNWDEGLPASVTAARVKEWIAALGNDADAVLKLDSI